MRMMRSAIMATLAKKVYDEARKPHNQAKIKKFVADLQAKQKGRRTPPGGGYRTH